MKLLNVNKLVTNFTDKNGILPAIRDISFTLTEGETLGIVGESGSGKSVTMKSVINILPANGYIESGSIEFNGVELTSISSADFRAIQGSEMAMIFQDSMTALNPIKTIGYHMVETLRRHTNMSKTDAKTRAIELLRQVEIPNPEQRINDYPHNFSGGMRQRVMIAMALSCNPKLLIADEPTTALDVTIQSQILRLLKKIQQAEGMAIILITHDLAVVYSMCKNIIVMYGGKIMESGTRDEIFNSPKHPYTKALLASIPKLNSNDKLTPIEGIAPSLKTMPAGCPFAPRCNYARDICRADFPQKQSVSTSRDVYCHFWQEA